MDKMSTKNKMEKTRGRNGKREGILPPPSVVPPPLGKEGFCDGGAGGRPQEREGFKKEEESAERSAKMGEGTTGKHVDVIYRTVQQPVPLSRPFTPDTRWIICVWDIRGEKPVETARMMRRPLREIEDAIALAKQDGYYERVQRYLDDYDQTHARKILEGVAALMDALNEEEGEKETGRKCG